MRKSSVRSAQPQTLEHLIRLFNEKKLSAEELARCSAPLLIATQQNEMMGLMLQLAASNLDRYDVPQLRNTDLYRDAEAAYDAKLAAEIAPFPKIRINAERVMRCVTAAAKKKKRKTTGA